MVTPSAKEPILTRPFVLAICAQHLYFAAFYSTLTALPLFLSVLPGGQAGAVIGAMGISSLLAGPFSGFLADRFGRRTMTIFAGTTTALVFAVHGLSLSLWFLVGVRLFHGAVMQFFATANSTITADLAPPARRGEAMGMASVSNSAAQIYAPWAGLFIAMRFGFGAYWTVTATLVGACTLLSLIVPDNYRRTADRSPIIAKSALLPLAVFTGFATSFGVLTAFLTPWSLLGLGDAGVWFIVFGVSMLAVRVNAGRLADRVGRVRVIVPAGVVCAAGMFLLSIGTPWAFYAAALPIGCGFAAAHTSLTAFTIDRAAPHERGAAIGIFFLGWGAGQIIGALGLGPLATGSTFPFVFVLAGLCVLLGLPLLLLPDRHRARSARHPIVAGSAPVLPPPAIRAPARRPALFAFVSVGTWVFLMVYMAWMSWIRGGKQHSGLR